MKKLTLTSRRTIKYSIFETPETELSARSSPWTEKEMKMLQSGDRLLCLKTLESRNEINFTRGELYNVRENPIVGDSVCLYNNQGTEHFITLGSWLECFTKYLG